MSKVTYMVPLHLRRQEVLSVLGRHGTVTRWLKKEYIAAQDSGPIRGVSECRRTMGVYISGGVQKKEGPTRLQQGT